MIFRTQLDRREWLAGMAPALSALGVSVGFRGSSRATEAATTNRTPGFGRARSVLIVFTPGGQSQLETWDPKPNAPAEIRGEFGSIPTKIPAVRLTEYLPKMAQLLHRGALIRSMTHDDLDHGSACYLSLTGEFHAQKSANPPPRPTDRPTLASVYTRVRPSRNLPYSSIHVNGPLLVPELLSPGQNSGFLSRSAEPLLIPDPSDVQGFLQEMQPPPGLSTARLQDRLTLLGEIDRNLPNTAQSGELRKKALELMAATEFHRAFDLEQESAQTRARYGQHRTGQACLLGRRLIEAGVPWVTVFYNPSIRGQDRHPESTDAYGWDTHNDLFEAMRRHLLPRFDESLSALVADLHERGLLDETLLVVMGEFGRAPRIGYEKNFAGSSPGRKHWAGAYSVFLAGAGITPGMVYGASDRIAAYPQDRPTSPLDLIATLFAALGIDPAGHFPDSTGRPYPISQGTPISGLWTGR
ncbi:DUF1501 domain-containing protein [Tuwongella immobilis]|uniref:DUF1501 domain-containing protein n=1 Tax=Tuwongella immobilis TaxID=692036 RepID=A0A6C2YP63_9BACT|nr:DUF1501 domain-containing protein [Tuwongella immobilis]VIP02923.1 secreted protein containing duf1501 : Uncharacterized protein OS=Singulisphaera acidiphila (strain ATCC BAA-1392 / DSM 18658 / VKM B-2454 / MOB10) GN=Sinac_5810 PE=4 SV=1: DUF1501 [Tuwongella immobilis]VTS02857.1 secreted protein containing duf1501 : Uncharacterized protein OS=Singulisphaera acidiphila (strain ATCC BAA-1392 / DSM 18658 / VKM B-2454 / MOB10) GN=Sinac_5810 PE=4 SV=1: DUF1501 [Tuwongella immobilis]